MRARREVGLAVGLCLLGAVLVLATGSAGWLIVQVAPRPPLPTRTLRLSGGGLVPVQALGLLSLAGVVALLATRRWGRLLVGVILAAAGGAVAVATADVLRRPHHYTDQPGALTTTLAPWPCLLGGVLIALAGLLVAARGRGWAAMSDRYDAPAVRRDAAVAPVDPAPLAERALWEALDNGQDPTL